MSALSCKIYLSRAAWGDNRLKKRILGLTMSGIRSVHFLCWQELLDACRCTSSILFTIFDEDVDLQGDHSADPVDDGEAQDVGLHPDAAKMQHRRQN